MSKLLNVSSSPHVRCGVSTKNLMYDVAIAMLPATIWGVMQFGIYSLIVVVATVLSCVLSEYLFETLMHKPVTIRTDSAAARARRRQCFILLNLLHSQIIQNRGGIPSFIIALFYLNTT